MMTGRCYLPYTTTFYHSPPDFELYSPSLCRTSDAWCYFLFLGVHCMYMLLNRHCLCLQACFSTVLFDISNFNVVNSSRWVLQSHVWCAIVDHNGRKLKRIVSSPKWLYALSHSESVFLWFCCVFKDWNHYWYVFTLMECKPILLITKCFDYLFQFFYFTNARMFNLVCS